MPLRASSKFQASRRSALAGKAEGRRRRSSSSPEQITRAIRRWATLYGEPPSMIDWEPARARRLGQEWRAERFESDEWPTARVVCGLFGSFNVAIEAAGLQPRPAPARLRPNLSGPEAIVDAFVEWVRRYGDVPTMADWDPARARRLRQDWRIARYNQGDWPSARSVALHFGSFANAAAAAGLVARSRSVHHDGRRPQQEANRYAAAQAVGSSRMPGLSDLADSLSALAQARRDQDPVSLHAALIDLAGAALAWAQVCGAD